MRGLPFNVQFIMLTHPRPNPTSLLHHFRSNIRTITFDRIYPICRNNYFTENTVFEHFDANLHNKRPKKTRYENNRDEEMTVKVIAAISRIASGVMFDSLEAACDVIAR